MDLEVARRDDRRFIWLGASVKEPLLFLQSLSSLMQRVQLARFLFARDADMIVDGDEIDVLLRAIAAAFCIYRGSVVDDTHATLRQLGVSNNDRVSASSIRANFAHVEPPTPVQDVRHFGSRPIIVYHHAMALQDWCRRNCMKDASRRASWCINRERYRFARQSKGQARGAVASKAASV